MILAALLTVTVLPTIWTLATAVRDRRDWARARSAAAPESLIALQAVVVESLRLVKSLLLIASVWAAVLGHPQPILAATACFLLGCTSLLTRWYRGQVTRRIQQEKRMEAMKVMRASSPAGRS